jgi:phospholipid transport system substrate-binding protein
MQSVFNGSFRQGLVLPAAALFAVLSAPTAVAGTAGMSPYEVVSITAREFQSSLSGKETYYSENLDELYQVVGDLLLPVFDPRYSAFLVLGDHWQSATELQRNRFVDAFQGFLVRTYAKGLLDFNQDKLVVAKETYSKDRKRAEVKTDLRMASGGAVPVDYRLRNSPEGWRVYDVRIEGISYIQNYRSQFNAEINALGLNALIQRLEAGTEMLAPEAPVVAN